MKSGFSSLHHEIILDLSREVTMKSPRNPQESEAQPSTCIQALRLAAEHAAQEAIPCGGFSAKTGFKAMSHTWNQMNSVGEWKFNNVQQWSTVCLVMMGDEFDVVLLFVVQNILEFSRKRSWPSKYIWITATRWVCPQNGVSLSMANPVIGWSKTLKIVLSRSPWSQTWRLWYS